MATLYSNTQARPPQSSSTAHESETLQYFLGLDGGGTRTRAVITDASLRSLSEATGGASNPLRVGFDAA
ncbi:MAG: hypothetical protein AB1631_30035, partial [Acidobacteriota bacterium]